MWRRPGMKPNTPAGATDAQVPKSREAPGTAQALRMLNREAMDAAQDTRDTERAPEVDTGRAGATDAKVPPMCRCHRLPKRFKGNGTQEWNTATLLTGTSLSCDFHSDVSDWHTNGTFVPRSETGDDLPEAESRAELLGADRLCSRRSIP